MIHEHRRFSVLDATVDELVEKLTHARFCSCVGFRSPTGVLWLNDSFDDSGGEFAVLYPVDGGYLAVESITVAWCDADAMRKYVTTAEDRTMTPMYAGRVLQPRVQTLVEHGRCHACA